MGGQSHITTRGKSKVSIRQIARVWEDSPYKDASLLIHLAIADFVNDDGEGFCSWKQIQAKARVSRRTVASTLERMKTDGAIEVVEEARHHRATVYRLRWGADIAPRPTPEVQSATPEVQSATPGVQNYGPLPSYTSVLSLRPNNVDAEQAAHRLADLIENNGSRKPTVTEQWVTEMDRMHRIDGRTWEEIRGAIEWSQSHEFWASVILSPKKLRAKFDQMRLQAARDKRTKTATAYEKFMTEEGTLL